MLKKILLLLLVAILGVATFVVARIGPRNVLGVILYDQRKGGSLKVGASAPDVELVATDGTSRLHVKDFVGGKPLVLVFGSYT